MKCEKCNAFAWVEVDREVNSTETTCISGHRYTHIVETLDIPADRIRRREERLPVLGEKQ